MELERRRWWKHISTRTYIGVSIGLVLLLALSIGVALKRTADKPSPLGILPNEVTFPVYFPTSIPAYYFVDSSSTSVSNDVLIFPISRNDGKKILVTEQSLPSGFDLNAVNGLQHQLPGVGTVVIGSGFLASRAVIQTTKTVIFLSAPQEIPTADLQSITYSFKQLN